jgi:hypothetical protein
MTESACITTIFDGPHDMHDLLSTRLPHRTSHASRPRCMYIQPALQSPRRYQVVVAALTDRQDD